MKKVLLSFICGIAFITPVIFASTLAFPDVKSGDWFYSYVDEIKNWGIVSGNSDGTYAPSRNINRAEFAKIISLYDKRVDQKINSAISGTAMQNQQTPNVASKGKLIGKVGDELYLDDIKFKVTKYGLDTNKTTNYTGLASGRSYYFVEFQITNNTKNEISVFKDNMLLTEPDGKQYTPTYFEEGSKTKEYRIKSGENYKGKLYYSFPNVGKVSYRLYYWKNAYYEVVLRSE